MQTCKVTSKENKEKWCFTKEQGYCIVKADKKMWFKNIQLTLE